MALKSEVYDTVFDDAYDRFCYLNDGKSRTELAHTRSLSYAMDDERVKKALPYAVDEKMTPDAAIQKYGLPRSKRGNPHLPCSCGIGFLTLVTPVQPDGWIYADYQCDSGWSNIFRFKVKQQKKPKKDKLTLANKQAYKPVDIEEY